MGATASAPVNNSRTLYQKTKNALTGSNARVPAALPVAAPLVAQNKNGNAVLASSPVAPEEIEYEDEEEEEEPQQMGGKRSRKSKKSSKKSRKASKKSSKKSKKASTKN